MGRPEKSGLSPLDLAILDRLARGWTNAAIGFDLDPVLTPGGVSRHLTFIYKYLGIIDPNSPKSNSGVRRVRAARWYWTHHERLIRLT